MTLVIWLLLVVAVAIAGALLAMTTLPRRRSGGLLVLVAAVAALLALLGSDLAALVWLGVGVAAAALAAPASHEPDLGPAPVSPVPTPGARLAAGTGAGLLFAMLYRLVLQTDWRPQAPAPVAGQTAPVAGRLFTTDLAPLLAVAVLVLVAFATAGARDHRDPRQGGGA
jgi:hypothetical protein